MTATEWLTSEDACAMLQQLLPATGRQRKLRLFACATCRRVVEGLDSERGRKAVDVAEEFADGLAYKRRMAAARAAAKSGLPRAVAHDLAWYAAAVAAARAKPSSVASDLLRDIFGSPFQPLPSVDRSLLTQNDFLVVKLAQAAYNERITPQGNLDPFRLGVLADAVEEAGGPQELVEHLRRPGPHYRGCIAIDLLTGRE